MVVTFESVNETLVCDQVVLFVFDEIFELSTLGSEFKGLPPNVQHKDLIVIVICLCCVHSIAGVGQDSLMALTSL